MTALPQIQHVAFLRLSRPRAGTRAGRARLWIEGRRLADAGFAPGSHYTVAIDPQKASVSLLLAPTGKQVHRRRRNGTFSPVVDVQNEALAHFSARLGIDGRRFQATFYTGRVEIEFHPDDIASAVRATSAAARPLAGGSFFHGAGILDAALKEGMQKAGSTSRLAFAIEREARYLEAAFLAHPNMWRDGAKAILADIDDVPLDNLPQVDFISAGIPCTGASWQGRVALGLDQPEDHPDVGHLYLSTMVGIRATRPLAAVIENVPEYQTTAGWRASVAALHRWGYEVEEAIFGGGEFGALDQRRRLVAVARKPALPPILSSVTPRSPAAQPRVADILDPMPDDSPLWRTYEHVGRKAARDRAAGHNFQTPLYTGEETEVRTLVKGYGDGTKGWQPFVRHPSNPALMRKFTAAEHARLKGVDPACVAGLTTTTAHEVLGQGVIWPVFHAIGEALARSFQAIGMALPQPAGGLQLALL